jgi:hypothetical protein
VLRHATCEGEQVLRQTRVSLLRQEDVLGSRSIEHGHT